MKLSQTEYNIKKQFAGREINPSDKLWDNIQNELDKKYKSNPKVLWMRLAAIAALLCLCFLAYKGLHNTRETLPTLVLDQKGWIEKPVNLERQNVEYVVLPKNIKGNTNQTSIAVRAKGKAPQTAENHEETIVSGNSSTVENEVESLLQEVITDVTKADQDEILTAAVEDLLDQALKNTQDRAQQDILKNMHATLLLAEVESEIELMKPPNLKDKIWEAIVSNYTDIKNSVVLN